MSIEDQILRLPISPLLEQSWLQAWLHQVFIFLNRGKNADLHRLIDLCLMSTLAVFQLYCDMICIDTNLLFSQITNSM